MMGCSASFSAFKIYIVQESIAPASQAQVQKSATTHETGEGRWTSLKLGLTEKDKGFFSLNLIQKLWYILL